MDTFLVNKLVQPSRSIGLASSETKTKRQQEFGDFQTPPDLALKVCKYLAEEGVSPHTIIEPTFGEGNFIHAALHVFPETQRIYGVEIQENYVWQVKIALLIRALLGRDVSTQIELYQDDIFTHSFPERVSTSPNILIIGNPPWVTNAELSSIESQNLPEKQNLKALNGFDALTGKSNFDIAEYILLRLLDLFAHSPGTLAILCKNAVAKNLVEILPQKQYRVSHIRQLSINAQKEFNAAVDASLLVMKLGSPKTSFTCQTGLLETPEMVGHHYGWTNGSFVSNVDDYQTSGHLEGEFPFKWRQGVKHDCTKVMELNVSGSHLTNGHDEIVEVEETNTYWLLKSSDLKDFETTQPRKKIIIPQTMLGEDTSHLEHDAPKLWKYLTAHAEEFDRRKSSIYRDKPPFSIFGIGEYSFSPYKIAISGLYKKPNFSLIPPIDNRPVMLDDTCYFIGFETYVESLIVNSVLNNESIQKFLHAIAFRDAKRPYTKQVLMRIDLSRAFSEIPLAQMKKYWNEIEYQPQENITENLFHTTIQRMSGDHSKQTNLQPQLF